MSAHAVLNDPQPQTSRTDIHQELAPAVLEKCQELCAEYCALAKADPSAFPFSERELLDWYTEMKGRVAQPVVVQHRDNRVPTPRRMRRRTVAA